MRLKGILTIIIALIEAFLCFWGPMSMIKKPNLILFPLYANNLSPDKKIQLEKFLKDSISAFGSFNLVDLTIMKDYLEKKKVTFNMLGTVDFDYKDCHEAARELRIERYITGYVNPSKNEVLLFLSLKDSKSGQELRKVKYRLKSLADFYKGSDGYGNPVDFKSDLNIESKGITLFDILFIILLIGQILFALLILYNRQLLFFVELLFIAGLILFLFSFIYAPNADLEHVQQFIAVNGRLSLADSGNTEQLYTIIKFIPLLFLNLWYYLWIKFKSHTTSNSKHYNKNSGKICNSDIKKIFQDWAMLWTILSALLFSLSFPSFLNINGIFIFGWICLVPLLFVLIFTKPVKGVIYCIFFGILQGLIINYWHSTYDYIMLHITIVHLLIEYLPFAILFILLIKKSGRWGFIIAAAAWVLFEYIRSSGILGYPWSIVGTSQYLFIPLIQITSITGVWGVSFIVLLCNTAITWALAAKYKNWKWSFPFLTAFNRKKKLVRNIFPLCIFIIFFCTSVIYGFIHMITSGFWNKNENNHVQILLIQQNADSRLHEYEKELDVLINLTTSALNSIEDIPDLVVWPEMAFKPDIRKWMKTSMNKRNGLLVRKLLEFQSAVNAWLITGNQDHVIIQEKTDNQEKITDIYNSTVLFNPDGDRMQTYHKMHLVPFSEYFPWKEDLPGLYDFFRKFGVSIWSSGNDRIIFQHDKFSFITPICFEDTFPDDIRMFIKKGVDIIINVSNDYWSLTPVAGKQHGVFALFRAVENQRPMVRATNSGYTVFINKFGQIQPGALEFYKPGYLTADVHLAEKNLTVYTMFGDWFPVLCMIILIIASFRIIGITFKKIWIRRKRKRIY